MAYDYETLVLLLKETGFVNIHRAEWGKSIRVNNIESIENNDNPRKYESLIIECERM